jgi:small GTP-binding protein
LAWLKIDPQSSRLVQTKAFNVKYVFASVMTLSDTVCSFICPVIKVIVLGCANVGKTSLMKRYANGKFSPDRRVTTGADFATKTITLNGQAIRIQIWDTAGQERFHANTLGGPFYRGADGALIVYDVSDATTFEQVV